MWEVGGGRAAGGCFGGVEGAGFGLELRDLLADFGPDVGAGLPVEADVADLALDLHGLEDGGSGLGDAVEDVFSGALLELAEFPVFGDGLGVDTFTAAAGEDVGVAENHLFTFPGCDVRYVVKAFLLGDLSVEYYMEEEVSELFFSVGVVVGEDGVGQLEDLFQGQLAERVVGLFPVPRAFGAEPVHYVEQPSYGFKFFFPCVHFRWSFRILTQI